MKMTGSNLVPIALEILVTRNLCVNTLAFAVSFYQPVAIFYDHSLSFGTCIYFETHTFVVSSVTFSRLEPGGKLVMGFRKASTASASDQVVHLF